MLSWTKSIVAILSVTVMLLTALQSVDACGGEDDPVDIAIDEFGVLHFVRAKSLGHDTRIIEYMNTGTDWMEMHGHGSPWIEITAEAGKYQDANIDIDDQLNIIYVTWLKSDSNHSLFIQYAGAQQADPRNWSAVQDGGAVPSCLGRARIDMAVSTGVLEITWILHHPRSQGSIQVECDLDGDFILDSIDEAPFSYTIEGGEEFFPDEVYVDRALSVSVAIDYTVPQDSTLTVESAVCPPIDGCVGEPFNISVSTTAEFEAIVKIDYSRMEISTNLTEKYFRAYTYKPTHEILKWLDRWTIVKNESSGADTGVDLVNKIVWAKTTHFSAFVIADSLIQDSDDDGLTDAVEINADGAPLAIITLLSDGVSEPTSSMSFDFDGTGEHTFYVAVPEYTASIVRANTAQVTLSGDVEVVGPSLVMASSLYDSYKPQMCIDELGTMHVVWIDGRDGGASLYYRSSEDVGATWSQETSITTPCISIPSFSFACDGEHLGVAYERFYKTSQSYVSSIRVVESNNGGEFWEELTIPWSTGVNPSIAIAQGAIYVVYEKNVPSGGDIPHVYLEGLRFAWNEDGQMTSETLVYTESHAEHLVPKIAVEGDYIAIVWAGYFLDSGTHFYSIQSIDGGVSWSNDNPEEGEANYPVEYFEEYFGPYDPSYLTLAMSGMDLYLAWSDDRDDGYDIFMKMSVDGGLNWGATRSIGESDQDRICPTFAFDSDANMFLTWMENAASSSEVHYGMLDVDGTLIADNTCNAPSGATYGRPIGAFDSEGTFQIVHERIESDDTDVVIESFLYPRIPTLDVGADGTVDWSGPNPLMGSTTAMVLSPALNYYLRDHTDADDGEADGYITVPIAISLNNAGTIDVESLLIELYTVDTDPVKWDTDGEGLSDGQEVNIVATDPTDVDTDGDTISDFDEVMATLGKKSDPLKADTDEDGIGDNVEQNVELIEDATVTTMSDGSSEREFAFSTAGSYLTSIEVPYYSDAVEFVVSATFDLEGSSYLDTEKTRDDMQFTMNDHLLAWADERNGNFDIFTYDYMTGVETQITYDLKDQIEPQLYGDILVWTDYRDGYGQGEIFLCDLESKSNDEIRITTNSYDDFHPCIWGDLLAWVREVNDQLDVVLYTRATGVESLVGFNSFNQFEPSLSEGYVAWTDTRSGNRDIFVKELATGAEEQRITDDAANQDTPRLSGSQLVWRDYRHTVWSGAPNPEIYSLDLSSQLESRITSSTSREVLPNIKSERVVWSVFDGTQFDIQMYEDGLVTTIAQGEGDQVFANVYENRVAWLDFSVSPPRFRIYLAGDAPIASIADVSSTSAPKGSGITFKGGAETVEGIIEELIWYSDRDGFLSDQPVFTTSALSQGAHKISFSVRSSLLLWSQPAVTTVVILNDIPTATITSISPMFSVKWQAVTFSGFGSDADGTISKYRWISSLDGIIGNSATFSTNTLSSGSHVITLSVADDVGDWSEAVTFSGGAAGQQFSVIVSESSSTSGSIPTPSSGDSVQPWRLDYPGLVSVQVTAGITSDIDVKIDGRSHRNVRNGGTYSYVGYANSLIIDSLDAGETGTYLVVPGILSTFSGSVKSGTIAWESDILREVTVKVVASTGSVFNVDANGNDRTLAYPGTYWFVGLTDAVELSYITGSESATYFITPGIGNLYTGALYHDGESGSEVVWETDRDKLITAKISATEAGEYFDVKVNGATRATLGNPGTYWYVGNAHIVEVNYYTYSDEGTYEISLGVASSYTGSLYHDGESGTSEVVWDSDIDRLVTVRMTAVESGEYFGVKIDGLTRATLGYPGTYWYVGDAHIVQVSSFSTSDEGNYEIRMGVADSYTGSLYHDGESGTSEVVWDSDVGRLVTVRVKSTKANEEFGVKINGNYRTTLATPGTYWYVGTVSKVEVSSFTVSDGGLYEISMGIEGSYSGDIGGNGLVWESDTPLQNSRIRIGLSDGSFSVSLNGGASQTAPIDVTVSLSSVLISSFSASSDEGTIEITTGGATGSGIGGQTIDSTGQQTSAVSELPIAILDSITPSPARSGEHVLMCGHGAGYNGRAIIGYNWRTGSDVLGISSSISVQSLGVGTNIIYFKVQDESGVWSEEVGHILVVKANVPPVASISQPSDGAVVTYGTPITFDAGTSSDSDLDLMTFSWDFGDGNSGQGVICSHAYNAPRDVWAGMHSRTITLTVSDGVDYTTTSISVQFSTQPLPTSGISIVRSEVVAGAYDDAESLCTWSYVDVGNDGTREWTYRYDFDDEVIIDIRASVNRGLAQLVSSEDGTMSVPIAFGAQSAGVLTVNNIHIQEVVVLTDPSNEDSDLDGLDDFQENSIYGTNPSDSDSDDDGLSDYEEIAIASNPFLVDSDGDALQDGYEVGIGTSPIRMDTDSDGLSDHEEVAIRKSNPLNQHSDGDGVKDGDECRAPRFSNPNVVDTDGDGVTDYDDAFPNDATMNRWHCDIGFEYATKSYPAFESFNDPQYHVPGVCINKDDWESMKIYNAVVSYRNSIPGQESCVYLNLNDYTVPASSTSNQYMVTFRYRADTVIDLRQYISASSYVTIKTLPTTEGSWSTISATTARNYYDYLAAEQPLVNVRLGFSDSIDLDTVTSIPLYTYECESGIGDIDANGVVDNEEPFLHSPGIYFSPEPATQGGWHDFQLLGKYYKRGGLGSRVIDGQTIYGSDVYVIGPEPASEYIVAITYVYGKQPTEHATVFAAPTGSGSWGAIGDLPGTTVGSTRTEDTVFLLLNTNVMSGDVDSVTLRVDSTVASPNEAIDLIKMKCWRIKQHVDFGVPGDEDVRAKPGIRIEDPNEWELLVEDGKNCRKTITYGSTTVGHIYFDSPKPGEVYNINIVYKSDAPVTVSEYYDNYNSISVDGSPIPSSSGLWAQHKITLSQDDYTDVNRYKSTYDVNVLVKFTGIIVIDRLEITTSIDTDRDGLTDDEEVLYGTDVGDPDTDNDEIFDGWEVRYGFNPLNPSDKFVDPDEDDFNNKQEYDVGTDPTDPDTDDDELTDWLDHLHANALWPDRDGDGLNDYEEYATYATDPRDADTDGDGLWDGDELGLADLDSVSSAYLSSPKLADSDEDGLSDGNDISISGVAWKGEQAVGTDPMLADTDGDEWPDKEEYDFFGSISSSDCDGDGFTNGPCDWDSDGDFLSDYLEYEGWTPVAITTVAQLESFGVNMQSGIFDMAKDIIDTEVKIHPDIFDPDTDDDGLTDLAEFLSLSNPMSINTDLDGFSDGVDDDPNVIELRVPTLDFAVTTTREFPNKILHLTINAYDDSGLKKIVVTKDGVPTGAPFTWTENYPQSTTVNFDVTINPAELLTLSYIIIEVTDKYDCVGRAWGKQPNKFDDAVQWVTTSFANRLNAGLAGSLTGIIRGFQGTTSSIVDVIYLPQLYNICCELSDGFVQAYNSGIDLNDLWGVISNIPKSFETMQELDNPYDNQLLDKKLHEEFANGWYLCYITATIVVTVIITEGVGAWADFLTAPKVLARLNAFSDALGAGTLNFLEIARAALSGATANKWLYTAGYLAVYFGGAAVIGIAFPDLLDDWFAIGLCPIMAAINLGEYFEVLDKIKRVYRIADDAIDSARHQGINPAARELADIAENKLNTNVWIKADVEKWFKNFERMADITEISPTTLLAKMDGYTAKTGRNMIDDVIELDTKMGGMEFETSRGLTKYLGSDPPAFSRIKSRMDYWLGEVDAGKYTIEDLKAGYKRAWADDSNLLTKLTKGIGDEHLTWETARAAMKSDEPVSSIVVKGVGEGGADIQLTQLDGTTIYREMTSITVVKTGGDLEYMLVDKISFKWYQVEDGNIRQFGIQMSLSAENVATLDSSQLITALSRVNAPAASGLDRIIFYNPDGSIIEMWQKGIDW